MHCLSRSCGQGPVGARSECSKWALLSVQTNILLCTLIHTPREEMIEQAQLYRDTLRQLLVKEHPTSSGTIHPDHSRDLQTMLSQSLYSV
jgi:hypothetical protein